MTCPGRNRIYPQGAWGQPCRRISQVSLFHPAAKHWTSGTSSQEHTPKQALTITKKIGIMMSFIATSYLKHLCFWARTDHADHEHCMAEAGTCSWQGGPAGSDAGVFIEPRCAVSPVPIGVYPLAVNSPEMTEYQFLSLIIPDLFFVFFFFFFLLCLLIRPSFSLISQTKPAMHRSKDISLKAVVGTPSSVLQGLLAEWSQVAKRLLRLPAITTTCGKSMLEVCGMIRSGISTGSPRASTESWVEAPVLH